MGRPLGQGQQTKYTTSRFAGEQASVVEMLLLTGDGTRAKKRGSVDKGMDA